VSCWLLLLLLPWLLISTIWVWCCRLLLLWCCVCVGAVVRLLPITPCGILRCRLVGGPLLLLWGLAVAVVLLLVTSRGCSSSSSSSRGRCPVGHVGWCLGPRGRGSSMWGLHGVGGVGGTLLGGVHGVVCVWAQLHVAHVLAGLSCCCCCCLAVLLCAAPPVQLLHVVRQGWWQWRGRE